MKPSIVWPAIGVLMIVFGIIALLNPFRATIAVELMLGWMFLIAAVIQVVAIFKVDTWGQRIWALLLVVVNVFVGISLLSNPLAGVLALTFVIGILFGASGLVKFFMSFGMRGTPMFWPMLLSGIISVILAFMILANYPASAVSLLGILLSVELISSGVAMMFLGRGEDEAAA
ncbi:Uncharacterized membrane protein HdeD, DUF308 family [Cognatiyoonia sediminum]|uniref:Uncharacterized membrane protein HdeD, DUF308 family n=1 Tax=Cognatiyoonia sediminum TaxID=1508389 RepID=A0A1M5KZ46_9RHOB|nr:DUF308 domain-containing protein [Cognatiyoonia sediminum]SHG58016.1 Uncharacterized membrane protein HdeD, DUF308 family [Cognatiyoonia sediminum]